MPCPPQTAARLSVLFMLGLGLIGLALVSSSLNQGDAGWISLSALGLGVALLLAYAVSSRSSRRRPSSAA